MAEIQLSVTFYMRHLLEKKTGNLEGRANVDGRRQRYFNEIDVEESLRLL